MEYTEFLKKVDRRANFNDVQKSANATKATLGTLGEFLNQTERHHLAAQLPNKMKPYVQEWKGSNIAQMPNPNMPVEEFNNRIQARSGLNHNDAVKGAKAVLEVLQAAVSEGELKHVVMQLGGSYKKLLGV